MLLCFVDLILGDLRSRGFSSCRQTSENLGARILTLHLNYVAGYTGPLLFLFDFLQADPGQLTTKGKPWRLRVWAGPKFIRNHQWGVSWGRTCRPGANQDLLTSWTTNERHTEDGRQTESKQRPRDRQPLAGPLGQSGNQQYQCPSAWRPPGPNPISASCRDPRSSFHYILYLSSRKGYCVTISRRNKSKLLRDYFT